MPGASASRLVKRNAVSEMRPLDLARPGSAFRALSARIPTILKSRGRRHPSLDRIRRQAGGALVRAERHRRAQLRGYASAAAFLTGARRQGRLAV